MGFELAPSIDPGVLNSQGSLAFAVRSTMVVEGVIGVSQHRINRLLDSTSWASASQGIIRAKPMHRLKENIFK